MNVYLHIIIIYFICAKCETITRNFTRRILRGSEALDTRPYMVYLRPIAGDKVGMESNWLCGGAIIHHQYILTSAACIEDMHHFFVVSGTHKWKPLGEDDECIKNGAKRAVWKCVPQDYFFDGQSFDNSRWMAQDIAVVRVDSEFNFEKRVRGCDYIPRMIAYNNISKDLEAPGKVASCAGWGTTEYYGTQSYRSTDNSPELLETEVVLTSKKSCKKRWPEQYHDIIDEHMICGKDGIGFDSMSVACRESELKCKELVASDEEDLVRRSLYHAEVHSASHFHSNRRNKASSGGFCENDHGGPLVMGYGTDAVVIGVISACMTTNVTHRCQGPFLYTSVYNSRNVISCAIDKDKEATCRRMLKSEKTRLSSTALNWSNLPKKLPREQRPKAKVSSVTKLRSDNKVTVRDATTKRLSPPQPPRPPPPKATQKG